MSMSVAPGDLLLGKYRVERALGQGGMGGVFAARHVELGELYAIKMMLPNTRANQDAVERFLREARIAAKLESEHVARVFDVGRSDDGTLFMVMEHLKGCDLKAHLAERGRLSCEEAIAYVRQACEALAEAHEMGIVHRDIKPANLFLAQKRKKAKPLIKVVDFGVSKELWGEQGQDLTKSGTMLGSPLYMSPEQMVYTRKVDARTDIWSLGVVLYELVTGVVPFPGETLTQVVHGVMSLEPAPVRTVVAEVPVSLDAVITRCLQKDAADRYGTVEELSDALLKVLNNEPVEESLAVSGLADTVRADVPGGSTGDLDTTDVGSGGSFEPKPLPTLRDSRKVREVAEPEFRPRSKEVRREPHESLNHGSKTGISEPKIAPFLRDSRKTRNSEPPTVPALRNASAFASNPTHVPWRTVVYAFLVAVIIAVSVHALRIRLPQDTGTALPISAQPDPSHDATSVQPTLSVYPSSTNPESAVATASNDPATPPTTTSADSTPLPAKVPTSATRSTAVKPLARPDDQALPAPPSPSTESSGTRRKRTLL